MTRRWLIHQSPLKEDAMFCLCGFYRRRGYNNDNKWTIEVKAPLSGGKKEIVSKADQQFITNKTRGCACVWARFLSIPGKDNIRRKRSSQKEVWKDLALSCWSGSHPTRLIQLHNVTLVLYTYPLSGDWFAVFRWYVLPQRSYDIDCGQDPIHTSDLILVWKTVLVCICPTIKLYTMFL